MLSPGLVGAYGLAIYLRRCLKTYVTGTKSTTYITSDTYMTYTTHVACITLYGPLVHLHALHDSYTQLKDYATHTDISHVTAITKCMYACAPCMNGQCVGFDNIAATHTHTSL